MVNTKRKWAWFFTGPTGKQQGFIEAIDPRDAISRVLTATTPDGRLFGQVHSVPMSILADAPGNADTSYEGTCDSIALKVVLVPTNVTGQLADGPFYIWANEDCSNVTPDFEEAKRIRTSLLGDGAEGVYIVDADGVEVVDAEIEADEAARSQKAAA